MRDEARDYLMQARKLDSRIKVKLDRYEELKALALRVTQAFSDMPKGGSKRTEDTIAKLIDMSEEINNEIDRLVDLKKEISEVIEAVDNEDCRLVLEWYYLAFRSWDEVASKMGYEPRQIYRIHSEALSRVVLP